MNMLARPTSKKMKGFDCSTTVTSLRVGKKSTDYTDYF